MFNKVVNIWYRAEDIYKYSLCDINVLLRLRVSICRIIYSHSFQRSIISVVYARLVAQSVFICYETNNIRVHVSRCVTPEDNESARSIPIESTERNNRIGKISLIDLADVL